MELVWNLLGARLGFDWGCLEFVSSLFLVCLELVWSLLGVCLELVWRLFGACLQFGHSLFGGCLGVFNVCQVGTLHARIDSVRAPPLTIFFSNAS